MVADRDPVWEVNQWEIGSEGKEVSTRAIEIDKERMASPKLTREIVYEKKASKYEGVGRFAHKLRQFYELYLIASFLFFKSPQVKNFLQSS